MTQNLLTKILRKGLIPFLILSFPILAQSVPTVNGLFYGDGDESNYQVLGVSDAGRGTLYYNLDGNILYVAMVVDQSVNDNVFGWKDHDTAYLQSAGWALPGGGHNHKWKDLKNSDHIQLNLSCGNNDITWKQDYLYDLDNDKEPLEADWVSDPYDHDGNDDQLPPGFVIASASSLSWDMNYAASNNGWDITQNGSRDREDRYLSPFDAASPDDVTAVGYPTWDSADNWEWAMVYEMSLDVGLCGDAPIALSVISAHNSPPKDGDNDVPVSAEDFGDAPDAYPTLLANNGARHAITLNGVFLGLDVDGESDGQPTADASGDDADGNDDEDGISFTTPFTIGENICFDATASGDGYLNAWIDFNSDGDWADSGEHIFTDYQLTSGTTNLCFPVPADAVEACTYIRFRFSSEFLNGSSCDDDFDNDGINNNDDDDDDNDGINDDQDNDDDNDGINDNDDNDDDNDGILDIDDDDNCNTYCDNDFDDDGISNNEDDDDDNDGICDNDDNDDDNDGINDDDDTDDDNDGILDIDDDDNCNIYCDNDFDDDGINNNEDNDDDNDGINDDQDDDDDNDGMCDNDDNDDDNDGMYDDEDDDDCIDGSIHHISYDGPWSDGEVEDYEICLVNGPQYDYGDAPDTPYPTTEANNGARHLVTPGGVYLGLSVDTEWDGQPNADATGDDIAGNPDDEDGVVFTTDLIPGEQTCFDVTASGNGYLNAWIDFNNNGNWSDSGEHIFTDYQLVTGTTNLCFPVPADAVVACTYMRFRYASEMTNGGCCCDDDDGGGMCNDDDDDDDGDDDDGGMCNDDDDDGCNAYCDDDFDNDGINNDEDDDDDNDGICDNDDDDDDNDGINDEDDNDDDNDGILDNDDDDNCNTYCDNDFDDDGINNNEDDDDDGDGICDNEDDDDDNDGINDNDDSDDDNDGINDEDDNDDCVQGSIHHISFDGPWNDGEVEDYQVCITQLWDFGDAPDAPFETLLASDGARHQIVPGGVYMGAMVDAEADGQTSGYADGDDLWDGSDDEDGIVFTTPLELNEMACFDITVSGDGYLNAWIDMYSNNTWADPLDRIFTNKSLLAGTTNLCFYIPPDAPEGYTYMRFRFSSDNPGSGFSYTGPWNNGEVEDYRVQLNYPLSNDDDSLIPDKVDLGSPYPNPFNPVTTVDYQVVTRDRVQIRVYDVNGRLIETLVDEILDAGYYHLKWNGDALSGGVYFLQLVNGNTVLTQKLILLK